jgi:DedD protein
MEIGLKERLIGAVVLVILAVIIIPWVLRGGSTPDTTVTKPLALPPAATTAAPSAYRMDLSNPAAPAQATTPTRQAVPAKSAPMPAVSVVKPAVLPTPKPAAHAAAGTGGWVVQAGSYSNETNARVLERKLTQRGFHAYISRFHKGGRTFYRVRVGPYVDRSAAERVVSEVAQAFGGRAVAVPNN